MPKNLMAFQIAFQNETQTELLFVNQVLKIPVQITPAPIRNT